MKIKIIAVGKISRNSPEDILCKEYLKRIKFPLEIKEFNNNSQELLLKQINELISKKDFIILLDAIGEQLTSLNFSDKLYKFFENQRNIIFLIGGDTGYSDQIKNKAELVISLGKMTYPHKIIRILLLEQLYRAQTINNNHPYNK